MPLVDFSALPAMSRVWVFGSSKSLIGDAEAEFLGAVDEYLRGWQAHGTPLTVARDWRGGRFLTIGVDPTASDASGCSLDALFRVFKELERTLGTSLLDGGLVYYRDRDGSVLSSDRAGFAELARGGVVSRDTPVFDLTVRTLADWRARFEVPAGQSWHAALLASSAA